MYRFQYLVRKLYSIWHLKGESSSHFSCYLLEWQNPVTLLLQKEGKASLIRRYLKDGKTGKTVHFFLCDSVQPNH